ncbi:MAG: endo alpha-1,4 polygalactosaminidase [Acidimicrobiia bacterium]
MKRLAGVALLAAWVGAAAPATAAGPPALAGVHSFALALGGKPINDPGVRAKLLDYDLVVVDGEDAPAPLISELRDHNVIVLGYLSVGTIEKWRSWYPRAKQYRGTRWGDWGEWYARVNKPGFRNLIVDDVAPTILAKGFDGLFLDNTDMIEAYPSKATGMTLLVAGLAGLADDNAALLFTQNGEESLQQEGLVAYFDGWNREDVTSTYSFDQKRYRMLSPAQIADNQAALNELAAAGLFVSATDYVKRAGNDGEAQAVTNACSVGAVPFASDIKLNRIPSPPLSCQ